MSPVPEPPPAALPLLGRRVAVTRARAQAGELVRALEALGAEVVLAPAIRIAPLADLRPLRAALEHLGRYAWVVFTSRNAVHVVCDGLAAWGIPGGLAGAAVAAIGPATAAALAERGVVPALVPEEFVAEAVVAALAARSDLRGRRVLVPRAREARDALPRGLRALGAEVDVIPVYETVRETGETGETGEGGEGGGGGGAGGLAREILAGRIDAVTFTSSSTVRHFVALVGGEAASSGRFAAAVIGPVTAATARELGIAVAVAAEEYTVPGLVGALARYFAGRGGGNGIG